ncbi:MAG: MBL fold metallo-hydrolase [Chitinophagaceae bacterium]|nr:MBL fold metallo-hydrolase [Chitinophagaceae bacterium]
MLQIKKITFSPFQENTYILFNEKKEAWIIDPGMYDKKEEQLFFDFIESEKLIPQMLLCTHTHIDHIFGCQAVLNKYTIPFAFHQKDDVVFQNAGLVSERYGVEYKISPQPTFFIDESKMLMLGNYTFSILFTPGHSPGSICFYCKEENVVISGDVLFQNSVGRTDLPGGDMNTLIKSIHTQLFTLPDNTKVFSGHGPETTIGLEKMNNPFVGLNK